MMLEAGVPNNKYVGAPGLAAAVLSISYYSG